MSAIPKRLWLHLRLLAACLILAGAPVAQAQTCGLTINGFLAGNPQVLLLSNFNLLNPSASVPLFRVELRSGKDCQVRVRFTLESTKLSVALIEAQTEPFLLSANNPPKLITNIDITTPSGDKDIKLDFFRYDAEQAAAIHESILRTGRLPNDRYVIRVRLFSNESGSGACAGGDCDEFIREIEVINPTQIDPIFPGSSVADNFCTELYTPFPQFSWNGSANRFVVTVCEVLSSNTSPEDVMQNEPRARIEVPSAGGQSHSVVYPAAGVWPLREGRTYYWQVEAISDLPGSDFVTRSEIWCFRLAKIDQAAGQLMRASVLNALRMLLAGTPHEYIIEENGPLTGLQPDGTILFNGKAIDVQELNELLQQLVTGGMEVVDAKIQ